MSTVLSFGCRDPSGPDGRGRHRRGAAVAPHRDALGLRGAEHDRHDPHGHRSALPGPDGAVGQVRPREAAGGLESHPEGVVRTKFQDPWP